MLEILPSSQPLLEPAVMERRGNDEMMSLCVSLSLSQLTSAPIVRSRTLATNLPPLPSSSTNAQTTPGLDRRAWRARLILARSPPIYTSVSKRFSFFLLQCNNHNQLPVAMLMLRLFDESLPIRNSSPTCIIIRKIRYRTRIHNPPQPNQLTSVATGPPPVDRSFDICLTTTPRLIKRKIRKLCVQTTLPYPTYPNLTFLWLCRWYNGISSFIFAPFAPRIVTIKGITQGFNSLV